MVLAWQLFNRCWRLSGNGNDAVQIDAVGHRLFQAVDLGIAPAQFAGCSQAKMPLGDDERFVAAQRAKKGYVGVAFQRSAQFCFVARAGDAVQDDALYVHIRIEGLVTQNKRHKPARDTLGIQNKNNGCAQKFGQSRVAVAPFRIKSVIKALIAFDQGKVGVVRVTREQPGYLVIALRIVVEIVARPASCPSQPHRIDIIRALFERLDCEATLGECRQEAGGNAGLAGGFVGG